MVGGPVVLRAHRGHLERDLRPGLGEVLLVRTEEVDYRADGVELLAPQDYRVATFPLDEPTLDEVREVVVAEFDQIRPLLLRGGSNSVSDERRD